MSFQLKPYQTDVIRKLKTGSILCGGVGSGKSVTALAYYILKYGGNYNPAKRMIEKRDLYIITTAKKRDSLDWDGECARFGLTKDFKNCYHKVHIVIDSWNNIEKYKKIFGAFFIFDEQRVTGHGPWVKAFLNITRKNDWILLSATPGDSWSDYIPVFVANGFYRNRTEFCDRHCVYSRYSKYPKVQGYIREKELIAHQDDILVPMIDDRTTTRHHIKIDVTYNKLDYKRVFRDRWDIYEHCPIQEAGKWIYLLRRVVNSDPSRIKAIKEIISEKKRVIIFYNYTYELDMLRNALESILWPFSEWNGQKHEDVLKGPKWAYLVQYSAGCEGWNCITTDTVIFFSQSYSYRMTEQACGRIDRINTPYQDLYYYYLRSSAPIDLAIYQKLKNKQNFNENSFCKRRW